MKKIMILSLVVLTLASSSAVLAKPDFQAVNVGNPVTDEVKNTVTVPAKAIEKAPGLFYLGQAVDPGSGKLVEGYAIVRYKKGFGKPGTVCGNGICEPGENARKCPADCGGGGEDPDTSSCYAFLAKDAKWKSVEDWMVDVSGSGLSASFVSNNLAADITKWEDAANYNILGDEIANSVDGADEYQPDDKNEVLFANIDDPGAIAVAIVWGIFSGPPRNRELVEWDQVYDNNEFVWSDSGEADKMDFENIATHELGHSLGLGDLYTADCSDETMYGYATEGETKKRDLNAGDITGIDKLY